jgi:hypothetical protein
MAEISQKRLDRRVNELWEIVGERKGSKARFRAQAERELIGEAAALDGLTLKDGGSWFGRWGL